MNMGVTIKWNQNQKYVLKAVTGWVVRELAKWATSRVPIQKFCVKQNYGCGSTIGPTVASLTGIRIMDFEMPQLSMHK